MELSASKMEGKLHHAQSAWCTSFPSVFGVDNSINPKTITTIPYYFILTLLKANFDLDICVANDVAIDVVKCALPGNWLMQWSPCPEVCTLANENGCYIMKLNNLSFHCHSNVLDSFDNHYTAWTLRFVAMETSIKYYWDYTKLFVFICYISFPDIFVLTYTSFLYFQLNYARYYLPQLLPEVKGRVIYIDDDCIVQGRWLVIPVQHVAEGTYVYQEVLRREILAKMALGRCVKFFT